MQGVVTQTPRYSPAVLETQNPQVGNDNNVLAATGEGLANANNGLQRPTLTNSANTGG